VGTKGVSLESKDQKYGKGYRIKDSGRERLFMQLLTYPQIKINPGRKRIVHPGSNSSPARGFV